MHLLFQLYDYCQSMLLTRSNGTTEVPVAAVVDGYHLPLESIVPRVKEATMTRWGTSLATYDLYSMACAFIDALYVPLKSPRN